MILKTDKLVLCALGFLLFLNSKAQIKEIVEDPKLNYYETYNQVQEIINGMPSNKNKEQQGEIKRFKRWTWFWHNRVDKNGEFNTYNTNYIKAVSNLSHTKNSYLPEWHSLGPTHINGSLSNIGEIGKINDVWTNPNNPLHIRVGTSGGGLWETYNSGQEWEQLGQDDIYGGVLALVVNPNNYNEIFVATGQRFNGFTKGYSIYTSALLKSSDGGVSFENLLDNTVGFSIPYTNDFKMNPNNTQELLLTTKKSVYKTINGGLSWFKTLNVPDSIDISLLSLVYDKQSPNNVFLCGQNYLAKSSDGGSSWTSLLQEVRDTYNLDGKLFISIDIDNNNQNFYVYIKKDSLPKKTYILKTNTESINWSIVHQTDSYSGACGYVTFLKVLSDSSIYYGGVTIKKFNPIANTEYSVNGLHADIRSMAFVSQNGNNTIHVAHDGGISQSTDDSGLNFTQINGNMALNETYSVALNENNPELYLIGAHDNRSFVHDNGSWYRVCYGDGGTCLIDYEDPNTMFAMHNGCIHKSTNKHNFITTGIYLNEYNSDYFQHPVNPNIIYATSSKSIGTAFKYHYIIKSLDKGSTWDATNLFVKYYGRDLVMDMCKSDTNYFYYAENSWHLGFRICKTTDNGASWTDIHDGLGLLGLNPQEKGSIVTDLYVAPDNPNYVIVTMANYFEDKKVFHSLNGGISWTNFSNGLPNMPVNKIARDKQNDTWYVATDVGVFYKTANSNIWEPFDNGLPLTMVTDIKINEKTRDLIIATYGRGVWKSCLDCGGNSSFYVKNSQEWGLEHRLCGNLTIKNNSTLTLKNTLKLPNNTYITVENGSTLILDTNSSIENSYGGTWEGSIDVHSGGKLIIKENHPEDGQVSNNKITIYVDTGAVLEFLDTDHIKNLSSFMEIKLNGEMKITGNVNLNLGYGNIFMNGIVSCNTGASLTIEGASKNNELFKLNKKINFSSDFNNITIKNGKIIMNNSQAELFINNGPQVTLDSVFVTSNSGVMNNHKGINIRTNSAINITNSTFEKGYYGVYASRLASSPNITITNCMFKKNKYALELYNSGFYISNSNFYNNEEKGVYVYSADKNSSIYESSVINTTNGYGVFFEGSSTAKLSVYGSTISGNKNGVFSKGPFITRVTCSYITNNTISGIKVGGGNSLYLASAPGINGGYNNLSGNKYPIYGHVFNLVHPEENSLFLNNGYNDLRDNGNNGAYSVSGWFPAHCGTLDCNKNIWQTPLVSPTGNDYSVLSGCFEIGIIGFNEYAHLTLTDNSSFNPLSTLNPCYNILEPMELLGFLPFDEIYNYRKIETQIGLLPLNTAVNKILNTDKETGDVYPLFTRYKMLSDLLFTDLSNPNIGEKWYIKHSYSLLKAFFGEFESKDNSSSVDSYILEDMIKTINKLESDVLNEDNNKGSGEIPSTQFAVILDKVHTYWYASQFKEALQLITDTKIKANSYQICELKKLACKINLDMRFIESNNTLEINEELVACELCEEESENEERKTFVSKNPMNSDINIEITPHPVSQRSILSVSGAQNTKLAIHNSMGIELYTEQILDNNYQKQLSNKIFREGIYIITITRKGKLVSNKKMVVAK